MLPVRPPLVRTVLHFEYRYNAVAMFSSPRSAGPPTNFEEEATKNQPYFSHYQIVWSCLLRQLLFPPFPPVVCSDTQLHFRWWIQRTDLFSNKVGFWHGTMVWNCDFGAESTKKKWQKFISFCRVSFIQCISSIYQRGACPTKRNGVQRGPFKTRRSWHVRKHTYLSSSTVRML